LKRAILVADGGIISVNTWSTLASICNHIEEVATLRNVSGWSLSHRRHKMCWQ
jgi:hypothetical protein